MRTHHSVWLAHHFQPILAMLCSHNEAEIWENRPVKSPQPRLPKRKDLMSFLLLEYPAVRAACHLAETC